MVVDRPIAMFRLSLLFGMVFLQGHSIEMILDDCSEPSCRERCLQETFNGTTDHLQCRCDSDCSVYGDCCSDYNETCANVSTTPEPLQIKPNTNSEIHPLKNYLTCNTLHNNDTGLVHYWFIGKCPESYPKDQMKRRCENPKMHPYSNVPVTAIATKLNYRNIFCARCHEGIAFRRSNYIIWESVIYCRKAYFNATFPEIITRLKNGTCIVNLQFPKDITKLRPCLPPSISRGCHNHSGTISSDSCHSYQRVVIDQISQKLFKNPSCATCDGVPRTVRPNKNHCFWKGLVPGLTSGIAFNFDFSGATLTSDEMVLVPIVISCPIDEVYDEVFDLCTRLYCPSGFAPINGKCVIRRGRYEESFTISIQVNDSGNIDDTEELVHQLETQLSYVSSDLKIQHQTNMIEVLFRSNFSISIFLASFYQLETEAIDALVNFQFATHGFRDCREIHRIVSMNEFLALMTNTSHDFEFSATLFPIKNHSVAICYHRKLPNCTSIKYANDQFTVENDTIQITDANQIYTEDEFVIYKNSVYVCRNLSRYYTDMLWEKFFSVAVDSTLSGIVTGVSITSCFLTLLVYCALPHLRNGPGMIIMSMTLSLLLAQLVCRVFQFFTDSTYCFVFGAINHSQWLSVFLWTSVMMMDISRSMTLSGKADSAIREYLMYAAIAWLSPAVVIAILATLDGLDVAYFGYGYTYGDKCWVMDPNLAFYNIGIPMLLCMVINIFGFVIIMTSLIPKAQVLGKAMFMSRKRQLAKISLKLSLINGGTWGIVLLANITQLEFMWYLNVLFNGLSGFYIFLSFVCNKKVFLALKEKCLLRSRSQTSNTSHS